MKNVIINLYTSAYITRLFFLVIVACLTIFPKIPSGAHIWATPTKHSQFLLLIVMNIVTKVVSIVDLWISRVAGNILPLCLFFWIDFTQYCTNFCFNGIYSLDLRESMPQFAIIIFSQLSAVQSKNTKFNIFWYVLNFGEKIKFYAGFCFTLSWTWKRHCSSRSRCLLVLNWKVTNQYKSLPESL